MGTYGRNGKASPRTCSTTWRFPIEPFYSGDGREYRTDTYRKADFIYRRSDGTEVKLTQVGIRSRGNESRRLPCQNGDHYKSHFKVKFDETFDRPADDPVTASVSQRRFAGLKALKLLGEIGVNAPRMSMGTLKFRIAGQAKDPDTNYRPQYDLQTNETTSDHLALKNFVHQLNTLEVHGFNGRGLTHERTGRI